MVLCEVEKYNDLKDKTHTKQSGLSEQEEKKFIEEGKAQALSAIQKKIRHIILFNKFVFYNEPPPVYDGHSY